MNEKTPQKIPAEITQFSMDNLPRKPLPYREDGYHEQVQPEVQHVSHAPSDMDPERKWTNIDPDLFNRIAEELFPVAEVVALSCGAEPLMNPDFGKYLESLYKADVPVREVVTNGTLLTDEHIEMLLSTPPTSLFVSIDGARPETHAGIRDGADLSRIISMLGKLIRARDARNMKFPMVSFSVTLQKSNCSELSDIVEMAAETGVESVSTVPLVAYEGLGVSGETVDVSGSEIQEIIKKASDAAEKLGIVFSAPQTGNAESTGNSCDYLDRWIFVDPDGKVFPCPYWNTSQPVGDFTRNSFDEIWNCRTYSALRAKISAGIFTGTCAVCPEKNETGNVEIDKTGL